MVVHSLSPRLLLVSLALVACSAEAPIPTGTTDEAITTLAADRPAPGQRAFRMRFRVTFVAPVVPPPAPCLTLVRTTLEGHATHLGRFTGTGSTCILVDLANPTVDPDPPFTAPGPAPYVTAPFTNPRWTLTAANGDQLWMRSDDAVAVLSATDRSLRAAGTTLVVGGTGRFVQARGVLQTSAVNEDGLGPDDATSTGWITY